MKPPRKGVTDSGPTGIEVRAADADDADSLARLHASSVAEGFLPTLGVPFLRLLYRRIARSPRSSAYVARRDGCTVGMVALTEDTAALYKSFLVRDGMRALAVAFPQLVRAVPRVVETLRYPAQSSNLSAAEILVVAVAPAARGHGVARGLVARALTELEARGVPSVRVVTNAGNRAALALYRGQGFRPYDTFEVHEGTESVLLVRRISDEGRP